MATAYNFDLLDLADGESGDAAVTVVVGKRKTEAAAAKVADPTQPAAQEKPKFSYYTKVQLDSALNLCQREQEKLDKALRKLRVEETKLKEQPGNEARLEEVCNELQKLKLQKRELREKECKTLEPERYVFYILNGIPLEDPKPKPNDALRICRQERKKNSDVLFKLEVEETKLLKAQPGNEARLKEISAEQQKLMLQQKKLWEEERRLLHERDEKLLSICLQEQKQNEDALFKLEVEETNLKGQPGNEARLKEISDKQEKLRLEQEKLWEEESRLVHQIDALGSNHNGGYSNNDGGSYGGYDDEHQTQQGDGCDHHPHDHDERQVERGHSYYNNGDRQGYRQRQPKMTKKYVPKAKASSDAGTEAEEKPENVVSATDTEQKDASANNADAVPASGSDKSAGGAAEEGSKKKGPKNTLSGSEKRKKKNAKKNSGTEPKQDSEVDGSTDKQPLEEEKKTLAEYEKMREEKKKTMEASKTEVRKVTAEEFKDLKVLEKKKLDDEGAVIKVVKAQPKVKEASKKEEVQAEGKDAAAKDAKTKKVVPLSELSFKQPRRFTVQEDGSSYRPRFNGGFQGGSRDNSTEPRINGRAAQNEAGVHNSNGAPHGVYNGRGDGAPRGDYSGGRGNGGYGYGRGHGGYQGNGGYQQQRQGGNAGQYQQERAGNGGYHQQRQGGNVGQYQQERAGNGGYHQQRNYPGSDRYYQQRGNSGGRRNFHRVPAQPAINVEDMKAFPALSAPASAQSAAPTSAPAPVPAQASAPAAAPAQAA